MRKTRTEVRFQSDDNVNSVTVVTDHDDETNPVGLAVGDSGLAWLSSDDVESLVGELSVAADL